jgi:hypothetical protein
MTKMTPVNGTGRKPGIGTGEDIDWEVSFHCGTD